MKKVLLFITLFVLLSGCKTNHVHSYFYNYDEEYHWKECSCGDKIDKEKHEFDDGIISKEVNENGKKEKIFTCAICQGTKTEVLIEPILYHDDWKCINGGIHHYVLPSDDIKNDVLYVCDICGYKKKYTQSLVFELNAGRNGYVLVGHNECSDRWVAIPPYYNGLPVYDFYQEALSDVRCARITLPSTIRFNKSPYVLKNNFVTCIEVLYLFNHNTAHPVGLMNKIEEIIYQEDIVAYAPSFRTKYLNSVKSINDSSIILYENDVIAQSLDNELYMLGYIGLAENVIVPKDISVIAGYCFSNLYYPLVNLKSVMFEDNSKCRIIERYAFLSCKELETINLPSSVEKIENNGISICTKLSKLEIALNNSLNYIGREAFYACDSLHELHVNITKSAWEGITKEEEWNLDSKIEIIHCTDGDIKIE